MLYALATGDLYVIDEHGAIRNLLQAATTTGGQKSALTINSAGDTLLAEQSVEIIQQAYSINIVAGVYIHNFILGNAFIKNGDTADLIFYFPTDALTTCIVRVFDLTTSGTKLFEKKGEGYAFKIFGRFSTDGTNWELMAAGVI